VALRISSRWWAVLVEQARVRGLKPSHYLRRVVERHLRRVAREADRAISEVQG